MKVGKMYIKENRWMHDRKLPKLSVIRSRSKWKIRASRLTLSVVFGLSFVFKQHILFNTSSSCFILQKQCDFSLDIFHWEWFIFEMALIKLVLLINYSNDRIIIRKIQLTFFPKLTLKTENVQFLTVLN